MTWLIFLIFLGYYAYTQFFSPAPANLDQSYVTSVALVLSTTAIVPFFISYLVTRATQLSGRVPAVMIAFVSTIGLSVFGYWLLWKYAPGIHGLNRPTVEEVLQMGLLPGVIMGAILAADSMFRRRFA
jgi:ABC-type nickel/cobalt efflux system permease component RcnA